MANKKLSEKTYRILQTDDAHTAASKDTRGAIRGLEFKDGTNKLLGPVELVEVETRTPKRYEDFSIGDQLVIDVAEKIVFEIADYISPSVLG